MAAAEAGLPLVKYEVCDNVDIPTIVQEFESYYAIKYGHPPKLTRRLKDDDRSACFPQHKYMHSANHFFAPPITLSINHVAAVHRRAARGPRRRARGRPPAPRPCCLESASQVTSPSVDPSLNADWYACQLSGPRLHLPPLPSRRVHSRRSHPGPRSAPSRTAVWRCSRTRSEVQDMHAFIHSSKPLSRITRITCRVAIAHRQHTRHGCKGRAGSRVWSDRHQHQGRWQARGTQASSHGPSHHCPSMPCRRSRMLA